MPEHPVQVVYRLLGSVNRHLNENDLIQEDQRGANEGCSGTMGARSHGLSGGQPKRRMSCIDVRKAYDSVDHQWLRKMLTLHRFPKWIGKVVYRLSSRWNTQIVERTKQGVETYDRIR